MIGLALWGLPGCGLLIFGPERPEPRDTWDTWNRPGWDTETPATDSGTAEPVDTGPPGALTVSPQAVRPWIEAGETATCLLDAAGAVACWGDDTLGLVSDAPGGAWLQLAMGNTHACALAEDGAVACWGEDTVGETEGPAGTFSALAVAGPLTCATGPQGALHCWGEPSWSPPLDEWPIVGLSGGSDHFCSLNRLQRPTCWSTGTLLAPNGAVAAVDAGDQFACFLGLDAAVDCTKTSTLDSDAGQTTDETTEPATAVTAGGRHACALLETGEAACWGGDEFGQATAPVGPWTQLSAGSHHTCALDAAGAPRCWGIDDGSANDFGQVRDTP